MTLKRTPMLGAPRAASHKGDLRDILESKLEPNAEARESTSIASTSVGPPPLVFPGGCTSSPATLIFVYRPLRLPAPSEVPTPSQATKPAQCLSRRGC